MEFECAMPVNLACRETPKKRLPSQCLRARRCANSLPTSRVRLGRRRLSCWAKCVMQGRKGSRGSLGSKGSGGTETPHQLRVMLGDLPFTSFTSLLLLLALSISSCSRSVATEPGVVNFLIESMPTNLDPRIGTDGPSERIDSLIFDSLVERDEQMCP